MSEITQAAWSDPSSNGSLLPPFLYVVTLERVRAGKPPLVVCPKVEIVAGGFSVQYVANGIVYAADECHYSAAAAQDAVNAIANHEWAKIEKTRSMLRANLKAARRAAAGLVS